MGCLVVVGLLAIVIGIGSRLAVNKVKEYAGGFSQLAEISDMNQKIRNQASFQPPADGRLNAAQVERYVGVQRAMMSSLGDRARKLDEKYKQLAKDLDAKGREANLRESLAAWSDVIALVVDAKREQVAALNSAGLSLSEYEWIRAQSLQALGYGAFGMNLEALASANPEAFGAAGANAAGMQVLQQNRDLLAPHEGSAKEWLPLSFFGL